MNPSILDKLVHCVMIRYFARPESIGFVIQGSLVQSSGDALFLRDISDIESNGHLFPTADSEITWE